MSLKNLYRALFFAALAFALGGCVSDKNPPFQTVERVDISKYLGRWVEVARYENSFEVGCYGASAEYAIDGDKISVLNRCFDEKGVQKSIAKGRAYALDETNSKLKVSFFGRFMGIIRSSC